MCMQSSTSCYASYALIIQASSAEGFAPKVLHFLGNQKELWAVIPSVQHKKLMQMETIKNDR